jgi:hypothetical protein
MWWSKHGAERRRLKSQATPSDDERDRRQFTRPQRESNGSIRRRCLALCDEVERYLQQKREQSGNS